MMDGCAPVAPEKSMVPCVRRPQASRLRVHAGNARNEVSRRRMSRRSIMALALSTSAALAAGCSASSGGAGGDGGTAATLTKDPVVLRLQQRAAPEEQFTHHYAAEFSQKYPNVKVEFEEFPSSEYWTKLLTLHASDQLGDLAWGWNAQGQLASWGHQGVVRALDDLAKADKYDLTQFYAGAIEADRWEGKLWAVPTVGHPGEVTLFFNRNLLDAGGMRYPDVSWKLDDLVEAARRLAKPDVWGYGSSRSYFQMMVRLRAFGGELLSPDGKRTLLSSVGSKAALQWEYDMIGKHRVAPSPAEPQGSGAMFQNGTMALFSSNVATVTTWRRPIGERFSWAATLFPPGPSGKRGTSLHTNTMHLTRQTKRAREGWELMKLLCSHEVGVQKILMESGSPGARPDVWNDQRLWDHEPWYRAGAALMAEARPPGVAFNLRTPEVNTAFEKGLPDIWLSNVSPAAGAEQIAHTLQGILDQPR